VADEPRDLASQYEDLLDQVWDSERRAKLNDRIDAAVRLEELRLLKARETRRRRRRLQYRSNPPKKRLPRDRSDR